jgi:uncharacterized membrane protein YdbT with pleckstrin-like domain
MAYPQKLLAPGEVIRFETRPHWRAIIIPLIVLVATVFGFAFLFNWIASLLQNTAGTVLQWAVFIGAALIIILWTIRPFLRWLTTDYVFTDRRIIVRKGIITRQGKDMPLSKINNVSFEVPALGRVLNYGALQIQSAGENDGLTIEDVPDVEDIQRQIYEFIEADDARRRSGGAGAPASSVD